MNQTQIRFWVELHFINLYFNCYFGQMFVSEDVQISYFPEKKFGYSKSRTEKCFLKI